MDKQSRIGVSFGQFEVVFDGFSRKLEIVDAELSRAARLETLAETNEVLVTEELQARRETLAETNEVLVTEELQARREIDPSKFIFTKVQRKVKKPFANYSIGDPFPCYRMGLKEQNSD